MIYVDTSVIVSALTNEWATAASLACQAQKCGEVATSEECQSASILRMMNNRQDRYVSRFLLVVYQMRLEAEAAHLAFRALNFGGHRRKIGQ